MRLTVWELLLCLYRRKGRLLVTAVLSAALAFVYVDHVQTYSAEAVIRYKDACVASGTAPDGTPFDVSEIVAPEVIAAAGEHLPFSLSGDDVRANTSITPVESDSENFGGSPSVFRISYRGNRSFLETQNTLDQLLDGYFRFYTEKYIGLAAVREIDYGLDQRGFNYLEQAELLQDNIDQTIRVLQSCTEEGNYRSPVNGLSFQDLMDEFSYLSRFKMPGIYSKIYAARLSKDASRLIDKYTERKEQHELNAKSANERALLAEEQMNAYAAAGLDVPGALIERCTADCILASMEVLDAQQCADIIAIFSSPAEADVDAAQYRQDVEEAIAQTLAELKELYAAALVLMDGFNSCTPQTHIECLTGIRTAPNVSKAPCVLLAAAAGFVLACMAVLVYEAMRAHTQHPRQSREDI